MKIQEENFRMPSGEILSIRSATGADAGKIREHRFITSGETHFMARYPEDGPLDAARAREGTEAMEQSSTDFLVTAFAGDTVVGDLGVTMVRPIMKYRHRAYLGMSIRRAYWECGLGTRMLEIALAQAKANGFEQVELGVFSDNPRAIHVYEKMGFRQYGRQPRAFKLKDGSYADELIMVKFLSEE